MKKDYKKTSSFDFPGLFEKRCAQCGKIFYPAYRHVFKQGCKWFCKYSCENSFMREQQNKQKKRPDRRRNTYAVELTDTKSGLILNFDSATEAAKRLDLCAEEIRRCCRGERLSYRGYLCEYRREMVSL